MSNQQINTDARAQQKTYEQIHNGELKRAGVEKAVDLRQQMAENTYTGVETGIDAASNTFNRAADKFAKTLGFSREQGERSAQNMQALTGGGMLLSQAYHDIAREWYDLVHKQGQRNLASLIALSRCRSLQEVAGIQSDQIRESLRHLIHDGHILAERSLRAFAKASKTVVGAV